MDTLVCLDLLRRPFACQVVRGQNDTCGKDGQYGSRVLSK